MDAYLLANKQMFTMQRAKEKREKSNMLSKYIKLQFSFLRIEIVMFKENIDLEKGTVLLIPEKWSKCGLKNS